MNADRDHSTMRIGVVGAGSWGTALANLLAVKGFKIDLWVYETEIKKQIESKRENEVFLPGVSLSPNLNPSNDMAHVVTDKDVVLIVVPSHVMRQTAEQLRRHIAPGTIIVTASKGIENKTHLTMTGVLREVLPEIEANAFALLPLCRANS